MTAAKWQPFCLSLNVLKQVSSQQSLVMPYDILVNIGSGNGLLPDDTKPSPESMLIYCQFCP